MPYCRELDGAGTSAILKYLRSGGRYLGLCAGGYYGAARVEFEQGNKELEISGPRELKLFPGTARGSVFKGFQYGTHVNAKAARIEVNTETLTDYTSSEKPLFAYVDGGCLFVDAETYKSRAVEVLARYLDPLAFPGSDLEGDNIDKAKPAAAVYNKIGRGCAVLTGLHPEFSPDLLKRIPSHQEYTKVLETLQENNAARIELMKALLKKMGLKVNPSLEPIPGLSRLSLTSVDPSQLRFLVEKWRQELGFTGEQHNILSGNNDVFRIWDAAQQSQYITSQLQEIKLQEPDDADAESALVVDYDKVVKDIDVYYSGLPDGRITPHFSLHRYYDSLKELRVAQAHRSGYGSGVGADVSAGSTAAGSTILYGEVVTSTSTMLFKNYKLLRHLPSGLTAVGAVQVAGRGRANNVWVNPPGVLAFSTVLRMPLHNDYGLPSPMVFVQYLAAIGIVDSIRNYARASLGIADFPVRIKWPNDVYLMNMDGEDSEVPFFKLSGILVNTTVLDSDYVMVIGIGINVANAAPSKSLNTAVDEFNAKHRVPHGKAPYGHFEAETLLAHFMVVWEEMLRDFRFQGFAAFEQMYYDRWLHTGKIVTLEQYANAKARIRGISNDFGMLVVEGVDRNNAPTGKTFELQPDGNSFDMLKGLLKKKQ